MSTLLATRGRFCKFPQQSEIKRSAINFSHRYWAEWERKCSTTTSSISRSRSTSTIFCYWSNWCLYVYVLRAVKDKLVNFSWDKIKSARLDYAVIYTCERTVREIVKTMVYRSIWLFRNDWNKNPLQNRLSPLTEATEKQRNQMVGQLQCHGNAARRRQATFSSSFERQFSYGGGVMESRKAWGAPITRRRGPTTNSLANPLGLRLSDSGRKREEYRWTFGCE
jgi:hypothetical protein